MRRYPRPACLPDPLPQRILLDASAGTGKTFTLEHLVLDLLLGARPLRIDQILVVTYTEKAAGEMRERIRALIENLLSGGFEEAEEDEPHWLLDDTARAALDQARMQFDRAAISTIHGFCQRLLRETAFLSGEPFQTEIVDGAKLFRRAVKDCIRTRWGVEGAAQAGDIRQALRDLGGEEEFIQLLEKVRKEPGVRCRGAADPAEPAGRFLAAYVREDLETALATFGIARGASLNSVMKHFEALKAACAGSAWGALETELDWVFGDGGKGATKAREMLQEEDRLLPLLMDLQEALANPLAAAADRFLPGARERAADLKEAEGLLDYDDMVGRVAQALAAPESGPLLAALLQARYQAVLIDEFQDTSPDQWRIFREAFGETSRLALIGDPKQAIYGFRGGDVHTYLRARSDLEGRGARTVTLNRNFRSTPRMIAAYNAILDQDARPPFFTGAITYPVPVTPGRDALRWVDPADRDLPPVRLVQVEVGPTDTTDALRRRVAEGLALEIRDLLRLGPALDGGGAREPLLPEDVFVLTKSKRESDLMAEALRRLRVPAVFFKREGVFQSPEARELLDVLRAVEDPSDPVRRAKAWITDVFGAGLQDLPRMRELPEAHPFLEQLRAWHDLAQRRRFPDLFRSLVDAGLLRRLLRTRPDDRGAGIWLQLTEFMLEQCAARHGGFVDAVDFLQDCIEDRIAPPGEDASVHRVATDRSAVQILTMHKSKGLEAKVVALFGGWSLRPEKEVHRFVDGGLRKFWVGANPPFRVAPLVERERREEAQRLLYVALTRAKAQLILPAFSTAGGCKGSFDPATADPKGDYGVLNHRLRTFLDGSHDLFRVVPLRSAGEDDAAPDPGPSRETLIPDPPRDGERLVLAARAPRVESFTSLSGEFRATARRDPEDQSADDEERHKLPGGTAVGTGLHALLEAVPHDSALAAPDLPGWMARPDVALALDRAMALAGLDPAHRERVAALAHRALKTPLQLPGAGSVSPGDLSVLLKEMPFLMPRPGRADLLEGSIDLLFQWEGRTYFLDWKTNQLDGYAPGTCASTLREHYGLQFAIYTLAACAFLGIRDAEGYEAFGGGLYVFLRGLPQGGQIAFRPPWTEVRAWAAALKEGREEDIHVDV